MPINSFMCVAAVQYESNRLARSAIRKFELAVTPPRGVFGTVVKLTSSPGEYAALIADARINLSASFKEAKSPYYDALESTEFLIIAADYLVGQADFPAKAARSVPPNVAENVRTARAYVRAGLLDGQALSDRMRSAANAAQNTLTKALKDFRRFESVAAILAAKAAARRADAIGDEDSAAKARVARARRVALHRARHGNRTTHKSPTRKSFEVEADLSTAAGEE